MKEQILAIKTSEILEIPIVKAEDFWAAMARSSAHTDEEIKKLTQKYLDKFISKT